MSAARIVHPAPFRLRPACRQGVPSVVRWRAGADDGLVAVGAEQVQDFHCFGAGGAEPVGFTGVELGHLARPESDFALPEDEAELASEHVEPFVAGVGYQSRFAVREYLLEDLDPARVLRQRDEDASAFPAPRLQMDARITGGRS